VHRSCCNLFFLLTRDDFFPKAALTDEELARKLQDEELVDAQAYEDQQSASDIYFTEGGFNDLKSNTEIADEDFYLAMQLQETELLAEQHRSIQSMQNARSSLSPNYRFEKGSFASFRDKGR
jgi:hypothetical protein